MSRSILLEGQLPGVQEHGLNTKRLNLNSYTNTSPVSGDMWMESNTLKYYNGSTTVDMSNGGESIVTATTVIATTASGAVANYYCTGTGDHTVINTAIDAVNAAGGGVVFLKAGTYLPTGIVSLKDNVCLMGEGVATVLSFATASTQLEARNRSNIAIRNMKVTSVSKTSGSDFENTVRILGCSNWEISGCYIDAYAFGLYVITVVNENVCEKGRIFNNYMQGTRRQDVMGGGRLTDDAPEMRDIIFSNNHVRKHGTSVVANNYNAIDYTGVNGIVWTDNIVEGNALLGYEKDPNKRCIVSNNIVKPVFNNGQVRVTLLLQDTTSTDSVSGQSLISNNIVYGSIWVQGRATQKITNMLVSGNYTYNDAARTTASVLNITQNGILIEEATNCLISGNYCEGGSVTAAGIELQDSSNCHVIGNYINDHDIGLQDAGTTNANNYSNNYIFSADTPTDIDVTSTENNNITA